MMQLLTWREHYQRELHAELYAELTGDPEASEAIPAGQSNGHPPPLASYRHGLAPGYLLAGHGEARDEEPATIGGGIAA